MNQAVDRGSVAVIGGGISGLVAADRLTQEGFRVTLVEADNRLGGKILTQSLDGVTVEAGPDSFLARESWAVDLCTDLGLAEELVAPAIFGSHVWTPGGLRKIPADFTFGMPSSPIRALRSGILSVKGASRAAADLLSPRPLSGADVSIGSFVKRRFGQEVLDRLVDPLLAGTRAGRAEDLSLAAAAPQIDALARSNRSVILGLRSARRHGAPGTGPPPFLAIRGGMQVLVERLATRLRDRADVRTSTPVERLERGGEGSYLVHLRGQGALGVEAVVIATPAYSAATLLEEVNPVAARGVGEIEYATVVTITLVYPSSAGAVPAGGSGLLVPSSQSKTLAACSWYSTKWPHRAPGEGRLLIRCFVGRASTDTVTELDDRELVNRVTRES